MRRLLTAIACAAAVVGLGACGKSDDQQASETVEAFVEANEAGDKARTCELLAATFKQQLGITEDCSNLPAQLGGGDRQQVMLEIVDVRVHDEQATGDLDVTTDSGESRVTLRLMLEDGDWRISGLQ